MQPLTWTTLEFEPKDRHPDWIWYAGLVALIVAIAAFFYDNIFFGILCIIAGATVIIYALRSPKTLSVTINDEGVTVNEEIIPPNRIKQFWLDETEKQDKLLLLVLGSFVPIVELPLENVSAESVRAALKSIEVEEKEIRPSNSQKIFDKLGF